MFWPNLFYINRMLVGVTAEKHVNVLVESVHVNCAFALEVNGKAASCWYHFRKEFRYVESEVITVVWQTKHLSHGFAVKIPVCIYRLEQGSGSVRRGNFYLQKIVCIGNALSVSLICRSAVAVWCIADDRFREVFSISMYEFLSLALSVFTKPVNTQVTFLPPSDEEHGFEPELL